MDREKDTQTKALSFGERYQQARKQVNWTLYNRRTIYDKPWMRIHLDDYEKADGTPVQEFVKVESADYVEILPIDPESGTVILICEYARGKDAPHIKLPAGKIKQGQTPLEAVQAELREETGHEGHAEMMATRYGIPMWYNAQANFAIAYIDSEQYAQQLLDKNEEIVVIRAPIEEVVKMVLTNNPLMDDLELSFSVLYALQTGRIDPKFLPQPENSPLQ